MNGSGSAEAQFDAIIVGGSFAGLAAALQLGRARRKVLVIDAGFPRNRFAQHSHGFLTQDGTPPGQILKAALNQLLKYPTVTILNDKVLQAKQEGGGFHVITADTIYRSRRLVLAYGIKDNLPSVKGLEERWGQSVFHCPYCHGYEVRDRSLGVYGSGKAAVHQSVLFRDWTENLTLFLTDPKSLSDAEVEKLQRRGVKIETTAVTQLLGEGTKLSGVELSDGRVIGVEGLLIAAKTEPNSDLHTQLGCKTERHENGERIVVDERQQTTVKGVFAAGDLTRMAHSVAFAVADGVGAASATHHSMLAEDWP